MLSNYQDEQFFKSQESWQEEIGTKITQFKVHLQKCKNEFKLKEEQLILRREMELKHILDIKELFDQKMKKVDQLYYELYTALLQLGQQKQTGRKREPINKRRLIPPFIKKLERRRENHNNSTTPTSPEHSLTSPDSPQKAPLYAQLNSASKPESVAVPKRKRHHRTNSGSPRGSGRFRNSSTRMSIDAETQTEYMDVSEPDTSPSGLFANNTFQSGLKLPQPQRVILQETRTSGSDDEGSNGNRVKLHYLVQHPRQMIQVFTQMDSEEADTVNSNTRPVRMCSDDDEKLETMGRKVSAIINGNIFTEMRTSENGNSILSEEILRRTSESKDDLNESTEDAAHDSFTDEERNVCSPRLRRKW